MFHAKRHYNLQATTKYIYIFLATVVEDDQKAPFFNSYYTEV